jgi:hypothetical protein
LFFIPPRLHTVSEVCTSREDIYTSCIIPRGVSPPPPFFFGCFLKWWSIQYCTDGQKIPKPKKKKKEKQYKSSFLSPSLSLPSNIMRESNTGDKPHDCIPNEYIIVQA